MRTKMVVALKYKILNTLLPLKADVVPVANCSYNTVRIKMAVGAEDRHSRVPRRTHNEQKGRCHSNF